jgi:hypothetical protein
VGGINTWCFDPGRCCWEMDGLSVPKGNCIVNNMSSLIVKTANTNWLQSMLML